RAEADLAVVDPVVGSRSRRSLPAQRLASVGTVEKHQLPFSTEHGEAIAIGTEGHAARFRRKLGPPLPLSFLSIPELDVVPLYRFTVTHADDGNRPSDGRESGIDEDASRDGRRARRLAGRDSIGPRLLRPPRPFDGHAGRNRQRAIATYRSEGIGAQMDTIDRQPLVGRRPETDEVGVLCRQR